MRIQKCAICLGVFAPCDCQVMQMRHGDFMAVIREMVRASVDSEDTTSEDVAARDIFRRQLDVEGDFTRLNERIRLEVPALFKSAEVATACNRVESFVAVTTEILAAVASNRPDEHGFDELIACYALLWELRSVRGFRSDTVDYHDRAKDAVLRMIERYKNRR